jgi:hypothetical protein
MRHKYNILPEPLHPIADSTIAYFVKRRGVSPTTIKIEQPVETNIPLPFRPTFCAKTTDHYFLCVEVAESPYNNSLDAFVLNCMNQGLPVKLFIAIPNGTRDPDYGPKLNLAKSRGVGVIEIGERSVSVVQEALSLSLAGVRPVPAEEFPPKLREGLSRAETLFRSGGPDKACSVIFDEIESICRNMGEKANDNGYWRSSTSVNFRFATGSWAKLMQLLSMEFDAKKAKCPRLTPAFLARIHGITPHRNESGHKPRSEAELTRRDRELRTRFESAVDLLRDFVVAARPLRLL